jgi:hypothetical protein
MRVFDDGAYAATWGESAKLYSFADLAVKKFLTNRPDMVSQESVEDLRQEGVTWLLESPGRAWVRATDGTFEDPEEQLVADIVAHLQRMF